MPVIANLPGYRLLGFLKNVAVRTGIYSGLAVSIIFAVWMFTANHMPFLEPLAMERNIIAAALLIFFACLPLIRFYNSPAELLSSGLLAWAILTFTYWTLCAVFSLLEQSYSAFHVFTVGMVSYLILATLSWIGTIIWRVRATHSSHLHH